MKPLPSLGAHASVALVVKREHLAAQIPIYRDLKPGLPAVCATAVMIALMEKASAMILAPYLAEGDTSVGVAVDVSHGAATPEGGTVRAEAELQAIEGKKFVFHVKAYDDQGLVGQGIHKRAIVKKETLEAAASARKVAKA